MPETNSPNTSRRVSLDVLRGFDMAWLLGADALFGALFAATGFGLFATLDTQMHHADWHGFRFYDLIFPLFIFISGVALGLHASALKQLSVKAFWRKQLIRFAILCALGVVYNHGWGRGIPSDVDEVRFASVLSRIAAAGLIASIVVYYTNFQQQLWLATTVFIMYSVAQLAFSLDAANSINAFIDQRFLPGKTWRNHPYDPEGLFGHIGASLNALAGAWVGLHWTALFKQNSSRVKLLAGALIALLIAYAIDAFYPINKSLWTGSFVIVTVAYSVVLLIVAEYLFDAHQSPRLARFFAVIGVNAIIAYLGTSIFSWSFTAQTIFKEWIILLPMDWQKVALILLTFLLQWIVLYWLDKKRAYVKI